MNVLVTGGTGSFGQAFVRYLLSSQSVERIVVFSRDWVKQREMACALDNEKVRFFLGDVCDYSRMEEVLRGIDTVVHAAAFKHVTLGERNPDEVVRVNVNGTRTVLKAAINSGVYKFIAISSDKAVHPLNAYGKSKALMENLVVQGNEMAAHTGMRCSIVRYGNVFGTRGSVAEVWQQQALRDRALTVNSEATRFLLTLKTATSLVQNCLTHMVGGEIFVPLIPSARICDLADVLYPNSYRVEYPLAIGEKTHEILISDEEISRTVASIDSSYVEIRSSFREEPRDLGTKNLFPYSSNRDPMNKQEIEKWVLNNLPS